MRADLRYTPWGKERWASNATPTEYQYTSQRNDSTLGLYDYNARYYDPAIGRFISADTIVPDSTSPQSLNRFSYVQNSPLRYIDPSGHDPLGEQWKEEFRQAHNREPAWYDETIRLFSIAYPSEWDWNTFYNSDGTFKGFGVTLVSPPTSRSWDTLSNALVRLSAAYTAEEEALFARDVGFLFGALPSRSQNPGWRGHRPYYSVGVFQENKHVFLQAGSINSGFYLNGRNHDEDFNVHHWAWAFAMGYEIDVGYAIAINISREIEPTTGGSLAVNVSDIALGNLGAVMGHGFSLEEYGYQDIPTLFNLFNLSPNEFIPHEN